MSRNLSFTRLLTVGTFRGAAFLLCLLTLLATGMSVRAQKPKKVHGKATFVMSVNDNITPAEAKRECIKQAQLNAIRETFGEIVDGNTNMIEGDFCGKEISSFVEEVNISSKAEWLENTKEPVVKIEQKDGKFVFSAEVWGKAREIAKSKIDLKWEIMTGKQGNLYKTDRFLNKQRIYVKFRSPVDGYLAIYLLDSSKREANCLLPYKTNRTGRYAVKGGCDYILFDRERDSKAFFYNMTTQAPVEVDNVVLLFSPKPFTKCNEITGDRRHPNSLSMDDFNTWVRNLQNADSEMVVDRSKSVTIINEKAQ